MLFIYQNYQISASLNVSVETLSLRLAEILLDSLDYYLSKSVSQQLIEMDN